MKHIQIYENKKKYKCDLREYSALLHKDLRKLIECVHENLKPHHCNICKMS